MRLLKSNDDEEAIQGSRFFDAFDERGYFYKTFEKRLDRQDRDHLSFLWVVGFVFYRKRGFLKDYCCP